MHVSVIERAMPTEPLVLLSLAELTTQQLDAPEISEKTEVLECWQYLKKAFPKAFSMDDPQPLKIRIHLHICRNKIKHSIAAVCSVLASYTRTPRYMDALTNNPVRIDLYGNPIGKVSAQQVVSAKNKLATNQVPVDHNVV